MPEARRFHLASFGLNITWHSQYLRPLSRPTEHKTVKYILLAVLCLVLGYSAALFFPADTIGLGDLQNKVNQLKGVAENTEESATIAEPVLTTYAANSFLVESDFVSVPGGTKPLGFRVGVSVDSSTADKLIKTINPILPAAKSRYLTANGNQAVVVVGGQFDDRSSATKALRSLQPSIKERLQIIYLPACVVENKPDDEGFICGPPPPPKDDAASAPAN